MRITKELMEKVCEACGWQSRELSSGLVAVDGEGDMFAPWERIESAFIALETFKNRRPGGGVWIVSSNGFDEEPFEVSLWLGGIMGVTIRGKDLPATVCEAIAEAWDRIKKE